MEKNILHEASTSYNDLKGTIALNFEGIPDTFSKFITDLNIIDSEHYFPVGLRITGGRNKMAICAILCANKKDAPINKEQVPVTEFMVDISFEKLLKNIKYIDIVLHSPNRRADEYVIEESIEKYA